MLRHRVLTLTLAFIVALAAAAVAGHPQASSARGGVSRAIPRVPNPTTTATAGTTSGATGPAAATPQPNAGPDDSGTETEPILQVETGLLPQASYPYASAACGAPFASGDSVGTIDGRSYRLHVPASYSSTYPLPLVLNFGGYGRTAAEQEQYSGLIPVADAQGFILVTPEGSGDPEGWDIVGVYDEDGSDDVAFTSGLIQQLEGELCINATRVYAIGISNGAEMASQLACDLPGTFAAVAAVAGIINQGCTTPVPVLAFHGTADENVPFDWAPLAAEQWASTNGCTGGATTTGVSADVELLSYEGCNGADVALYIIDGGGHTWPGAPDNSGGVGPTTHEIDASQLAWDFFQAHPKSS